MLRQSFAAGIVGLIGLGLASQASAAVLYDGNGFEPSTTNPAKNFSAGFAGRGANLVGQPAASLDPWAQDSSTSASITATVGAYVAPQFNNLQFVAVDSFGTAGTDAGFFYPTTFTNGKPAYTPAAGQKINILWTMTTSSGAVGSPFFGIDAYGSGGEIARFGVNATTGELVANGAVVPGFTAAAGTFAQYALQLDYAAQTYSVFTAPADNSSPFVLRGSGAFLNAATDFTDADIATFGLSAPGTAFGGTGIFDNYSVQTVPEPASLGVAGVALGLLARRRAGRERV